MGENPATAAEQELFEQEQPVLDTLANVNRRTGFVDDGAGLTFDEVRLMYDMCRYDRAARPGLPSAWCSPFEEDDMVVSAGDCLAIGISFSQQVCYQCYQLAYS